MNVLSIDLGASSGRIVLCSFDGKKIVLKEIFRFSNSRITVNESEHWDVFYLLRQIKNTIAKSANENWQIASLGIDTWGVDFGLFDKNQKLLENPYYYLDKRSAGMQEKLFEVFDKKELERITGGYIHPFGTLCQLFSMIKNKSKVLDRAEHFLLMPAIFDFYLTGIMSNEYTAASTTNLISPLNNKWLPEIIKKIGVRECMFGKILKPGTVKGGLTKEIQNELNVKNMKVVSVASHDTASAVAAIPAKQSEFLFISSGSCSIIGLSVDKAVIDEKANEEFVNEGSSNGKKRLVKNVMGMYYFQQCKAYWDSKGKNLSFQQIQDSARQQELFNSFIDLEDSHLLSPGNTPEKIAVYCRAANQTIPETIGEISLCIAQSLAMFYKYYIGKLEKYTDKKLDTIYIVGGGVQHKLICQFTANAAKKRVVAAYSEAAVLGNALVQLIALNQIKQNDRKQIVENSFCVKEYFPEDVDSWDNGYESFRKVIHIK